MGNFLGFCCCLCYYRDCAGSDDSMDDQIGRSDFDIFLKIILASVFSPALLSFLFFLAFSFILCCGLANKKNWNFLKLAMWSFAFVLLGFSTYFTTLIRSNADPAIDMFNVDNPVSLVGYLSREQYGDWPILYGQDFTA